MNKKDLIIEVATKLFSERGFDKTPISAVCEMANVSKGLVFHHFKNKNELLREIFKKTTNFVVEKNQSIPENLSPNERLRELIDGAFELMKENKLFFRLYLNVMFQPTTRAFLDDLIKERAAILLTNTEALFSAISKENSELKAYMLISDLDGIGMNYIYSYEDYPLDLVKEQFIKRYVST